LSSFNNREWERWFPESAAEKPVTGARRGRGSRAITILAAIVIVFIVLNISKGFYTEWLWFSSLGYGDVYATVLKAKVLVFFSAAIIFLFLFLGNLVLTARLIPNGKGHIWPWTVVRQPRPVHKWAVIGGTGLLSVIFGLVAAGRWLVVLQFLNRQPFGIGDPVFHKDIAFYVFSLPFLQMLRSWFLAALIVTLIGSILMYVLVYGIERPKLDFPRRVLAHGGGLIAATLSVAAWGYWLGIWELAFSRRGVVFGPSYTDMHAQLPAQWIMLVVAIISIVIMLFFLLRRKLRWAMYSIGAWVAAGIILGMIFPDVVQRFQVEPNELVRETPYIEHNIQATRCAYALDRVEEESFPAEEAPSAQDVGENHDTIHNIRLWDHRPLKDTYNQIQAIRLYYDFHDVDIDRYVIDDEYRQVLLSARELSPEKLAGEAQTWVNRRLQFTHGYGVAMSPANAVSLEGLPELLIKDIPPVGDFDIERPQIYFGEKTKDYVIVNTDTQEFDYPMGDENVYGYYEGQDGVGIGTFIRRLVYAWQFGDFNILISSELNSESRLLYYRNISERVNHLAPFLKLDRDPYLVVKDGKLFWVQDAYTITDRYPYSEPNQDGLNYIRNSVKAIVDAYDGSVTFYVTEPEDALVRTYQAVFPKLFLPIDQMPEFLRVHLRYPEDMFNIQASVYQSYHMRDARVLYNREDLWAVPKEVYAGSEQLMQPYYIIMRLLQENEEEFLLMLPFTPVNKNNTIGWLAGRCDGENYGKLLAYHFPKERLVYGPSQIENRIQQDTIITEQFALWDRGGSQVIRGNLLMIPLGKSNLYVEPVFLQAESGGLPELKRVIVAAGDKIVMQRTLEESMAVIFGTDVRATGPAIEPALPPEPESVVSAELAGLIEQALQHYEQAQQYLKAADWTGYGKELDALKAVLNKLNELASTL
jgi:uncharacterized protein